MISNTGFCPVFIRVADTPTVSTNRLLVELLSIKIEFQTISLMSVIRIKIYYIPPLKLADLYHLCRELVCITVKWTRYNGRETFFHITPGRINTYKGVNQLTELFFSKFNYYYFLNMHLKLTNHRYFIIKNPLCFAIHNKIWVLL